MRKASIDHYRRFDDSSDISKDQRKFCVTSAKRIVTWLSGEGITLLGGMI